MSAATTELPPARPARARSDSPFAALGFRPFRRWFLSQILSASGGMTQGVATSWLVLEMTGSALDLGVLSAVSMLPSLLAGAWCGAVVDRLDRRRVLMATQAALTLLSLLLYALIESGTVGYWSILAISAAGGLVNAMDGPARQVYVLDLVGRRRLASAVSLYEVILNTSRVLGPALGGVMLAVVGPGACVLTNAVSFVAPLVVLVLQGPTIDGEVVAGAAAGLAADAARSTADGRPAAEPGRPATESGRRIRQRGAARAGLRYAWSVPAIRACLLIAAASGILFNPSILFPLIADRAFHLGGGGYGALLSAFGLGALPGALLAARGGEPTGRQVSALAALPGLCTAATAAAPDVALLYLGVASIGFSSIWMIARANTLVQLCAAPELRGRVMGAWTMALPGFNPVTALAVGALADAAGARAAFAAAGVMMLAVVVVGRRALAGQTVTGQTVTGQTVTGQTVTGHGEAVA